MGHFDLNFSWLILFCLCLSPPRCVLVKKLLHCLFFWMWSHFTSVQFILTFLFFTLCKSAFSFYYFVKLFIYLFSFFFLSSMSFSPTTKNRTSLADFPRCRSCHKKILFLKNNTSLKTITTSHSTLSALKACREKLRGLQSKITAFNERIKLLNQRGTPDEVELWSE